MISYQVCWPSWFSLIRLDCPLAGQRQQAGPDHPTWLCSIGSTRSSPSLRLRCQAPQRPNRRHQCTQRWCRGRCKEQAHPQSSESHTPRIKEKHVNQQHTILNPKAVVWPSVEHILTKAKAHSSAYRCSLCRHPSTHDPRKVRMHPWIRREERWWQRDPQRCQWSRRSAMLHTITRDEIAAMSQLEVTYAILVIVAWEVKLHQLSLAFMRMELLTTQILVSL